MWCISKEPIAGRICSFQVLDTDSASPGQGAMLNACANTMDVKITDPGRFVQNIPGIHQVMITGNYTKAIGDALFGMNTNLVGPSDFTAPGA